MGSGRTGWGLAGHGHEMPMVYRRLDNMVYLLKSPVHDGWMGGWMDEQKERETRAVYMDMSNYFIS